MQPGVHANGVGSHALDVREIDSEAIAMARVVVDSMEAVQKECGDIMIPAQDSKTTLDHLVGEIGEVIADTKRGRTSPDDITIYKSLGIAIQDVATGHMVYRKAVEIGLGTHVQIAPGLKHTESSAPKA